MSTMKEEFLEMAQEEREIEQKMIKVVGNMPAGVQSRFKVMHMLSDERSKINDEFEKEVKALEDKFRTKKQPLLEMRNDIVLGKATDFADKLEKYEENFKEVSTIVAGIVKSQKEKDADEDELKDHVPTNVDHLKEVQGVPDFWSKAVTNHQIMLQYIREKDREVLPHLTNVTCFESNTPVKTIAVELTFSENEWFTNEKLSLKVTFKKDQDDEVAETEGCLIDWKDGKDLSKKKIKKKQKNKKTGETRQIVKSVPADSFFNAFESRKCPEPKNADDDEDEELEKLLDSLEESMQVAMDFNDLYNFEALEYYLNFGQSEQDFADMHGQGSDDDDEDKDDDEDADSGKKKSKKAPKEGSAEEKQECKQQ